jgi:hypothetical protein
MELLVRPSLLTEDEVITGSCFDLPSGQRLRSSPEKRTPKRDATFEVHTQVVVLFCFVN